MSSHGLPLGESVAVWGGLDQQRQINSRLNDLIPELFEGTRVSFNYRKKMFQHVKKSTCKVVLSTLQTPYIRLVCNNSR